MTVKISTFIFVYFIKKQSNVWTFNIKKTKISKKIKKIVFSIKIILEDASKSIA